MRGSCKALGLVVVLALGACQERTIAIGFDRAAEDLTGHVYPTDQYRGDEVLDAFSERQLAALPFLHQLGDTHRDGFGAATAIRLPFTPSPDDAGGWIDADGLTDAIRVYRVSSDPPRRVTLGRATVERHTNTVTVTPAAPWTPGSYAVVVLAGEVRTRDGATVTTSDDYARVQRDGDALTDGAFGAVAAVDDAVRARTDTIAFFTFTVGEDTDQLALLARYVDGKLAVDRDGDDALLDITPLHPAGEREIAAGDAEVVAATPYEVARLVADLVGPGLPTDAIDRVVVGALATPNFVSDTIYDEQALHTNGTFLGRNPLIDFTTDNPLSLSTSAPSRIVPYLAIFPKASEDPPPVVVALHGISRQKEDWLAAANALCASGHVVIAIDFYQHGARQRDIAVPEGDFGAKVDPVLAAGGQRFPDPFIDPTFLARTRDKLRQSIVDELALIRILASANGESPLIDLDGDGTPDDYGAIHLVGQSLGSILGTMIAAVSPDVDRVVLSVPGGSLLQVLEESPALHGDIDVLIYLTANAPGFGLLAGQTRAMLPDDGARQLFDRVAETVLAPVDPLTYAPAVLSGDLGNARPRVLVQLALNDLVVPNTTNTRLVQALAAGVDDPRDFPQIPPVEVETGLPSWEGAALPVDGVASFVGVHQMLLDWSDPEGTAAAQAQMVEFLTAQ
ncbi:MAG: hypothetical protein EP329_25240 [Deltaproteobacteria bacterium]|nr:MAG: hypothetical protein EP329_25240 [Deltaproteobacteria bacterium]